MDSRATEPAPPRRPYRSRRRRPCDVCRRRKQSCRIEGASPCTTCRTLGTPCTFNDPPCQRRRQVVRVSAVANQPDELHAASQQEPTWPIDDGLPLPLESIDATLFASHDSLWRAPFSPSELFPLEEVLPNISRDPAVNRPVEPWSQSEKSNNPATTVPLAARNQWAENHEEESFSSGQSPSSGSERDPDEMTQPSLPVKSLDHIEGFATQYLGLSADMDPYLLRDLQRDDGASRFPKFPYRGIQSGDAIAETEQIPVQFVLNSTHARTDPHNSNAQHVLDPEAAAQNKLDAIVCPETGVRLMSLFLRFVFPSFPVLSRTRLDLSGEKLVPQLSCLRLTPSYLLAVIYALALPFWRQDPLLCVSQSHANIPVNELRKIALEGVLSESQVPKLSVLQATLLYLQITEPGAPTKAPETHFRWSLLGFAVSLSNTLGLHLDCLSWPIPAWEKRLRRRLWWITFCDATWRSLLTGYTNPIVADQWEVSPLSEQDFVIDDLSCPTEATRLKETPERCEFCHRGYDFLFTAALSIIAYDVYTSFYTLRATRKCASDFKLSFETAKSLLQRIENWDREVPSYLRRDAARQPIAVKTTFHSYSSAYLRLACLTLEVLVHRAVFRSMKTASGGPSIDLLPNSVQPPTWQQDYLREARHKAKTTLMRLISFAQGLSCKDANSFWHSWARVCFSAISNFIILQLLKSSNRNEAKEAIIILDQWSAVLREQSILFDQIHSGLHRLDTILLSGFDNLFSCRGYIQDVLQERANAESEIPTKR